MNRTFKDMIGNEFTIPFPPQRIISLVPSQTELLFDLGLREEVVGITKFCVHPEEWFRSKTRIGGTKQLNIEKIKELKPDLIIANKEENEKNQVQALAQHFPVWTSDIKDLQQALQMIRFVGQLVGKDEQANHIAATILSGFSTLQKANTLRRVAYFIWYRPWMSVGHDTFISNMIETIGWTNVFNHATRYPEVTPEQLPASNPDLVLLSSEPYPFKEKHIAEIQAILPHADVKLVDGEMFSWYGSRLQKAISYFNTLIN